MDHGPTRVLVLRQMYAPVEYKPNDARRKMTSVLDGGPSQVVDRKSTAIKVGMLRCPVQNWGKILTIEKIIDVSQSP